MGKNSGPSLPATPTHYNNSNLLPNIDFGSNFNRQLLQGNFSGDLQWLNPLVNTNTSANALSYAQGLLQPQFRDTLNQITQAAANNNQLNSSTFTDALARSQSDLNSQYQSIVSQGAINDAYQNNSNRLSLLGIGENGLQGFTGLAQGDTNATNQFNLDNYNNQVAAALASQKQANGGFLGGLMGAGGGALAGLALAPFTGGSSLLLAGLGAGLGGAAGALTPQSQNVSGSLLGAGAGLAGSTGGLSVFQRTGASAPFAGSYAQNFPTNPRLTPYGSNPFSSGWPY